MYNFDLSSLQRDKWHTLHFEWDIASTSKNCSVMDENGNEIATLPLNRESVNGLSYVHFISTAEQEDLEGFLIKGVESKQN
jgi:hypothetical protein